MPELNSRRRASRRFFPQRFNFSEAAIGQVLTGHGTLFVFLDV
jgi:hypothetical protein